LLFKTIYLHTELLKFFSIEENLGFLPYQKEVIHLVSISI